MRHICNLGSENPPFPRTAPKVSFATILDAYVILCIYIILLIGVVSFSLSCLCTLGGTADTAKLMKNQSCRDDPGTLYALWSLPRYSPVFETSLGLALFAAWLAYNAWYWGRAWKRVLFNVEVVDAAGLQWLSFKSAVPGKKGAFRSERLIHDEGALARAVKAFWKPSFDPRRRPLVGSLNK